MKNVSLVAFYGNKPPQLRDLIQQLQDYLANCSLVKGKFIPYQMEQVHGTIIGCEGTTTESGVINRWFGDRRQERRYIDFVPFADYLQHQIDLPVTIRFGGYDRNTDYNFLSRNQSLYSRSFQLQPAANQTVPVLIGWSWSGDRVSLAIDDLRRSFQQFNLLHKYHATPEAIDNDFYLRLGTVDAVLTPEVIQTISKDVCNQLGSQNPLYVAIERDNLTIARYQDLSLTPATTKTLPIRDLTINKLKQMYDL